MGTTSSSSWLSPSCVDDCSAAVDRVATGMGEAVTWGEGRGGGLGGQSWVSLVTCALCSNRLKLFVGEIQTNNEASDDHILLCRYILIVLSPTFIITYAYLYA